MKRFPLLLAAVLLGSIGAAVAAAEDQTDSTQTPKNGYAVRDRLIPILGLNSPGGDRIRELQATLNGVLGGVTIDLPPGSKVERGSEEKDGVSTLILSGEGKFEILGKYRIRGDWKPLDKSREIIEESSTEVECTALEFPRVPLKVDGVYGQHTYIAVLLFQVANDLEPTGEVDAVTLDKLKPLVPSNPILAGIMSQVEKHADLDPTSDSYASRVKGCTAIVMTLLILLVSVFVYHFARGLANSTKFLSRWLFTPGTSPWFTALREKQVFVRAAQFAPAIFIYTAAFAIFPEDLKEEDPFPYLNTFQEWGILLSRFGLAYVAFICMRVGQAVVNACDAVYTADLPDDNPMEGILRAAKRVVTLVGLVLMFAALRGRSPLMLVGGLGAFMAVIMLVFKDSILGLVASIQIVANKMVKIGDWIEMSKYGADGDVIQISLACVKVQNFDKTISTIPTYALLSDSFRNWSGIQFAGGRRIKRAIFIDMHSIQVCTPEMIERFEEIELIGDYIREKKLELERYNDEHDVDASLVNSRRMTNIGTFRAYLEAYLADHPKLSGEMMRLVRHLQPTEVGLPIEIYAFCSDTAWTKYEAVQADIFDHLLAILPGFQLRAFQDITDADEVSSEGPKSPASRANRATVADTRPALKELRQFIRRQNRYLADHPNARLNVAIGKVEKKLKQLGIDDGSKVTVSGRTLSLESCT